jgi:hypothetical protein
MAAGRVARCRRVLHLERLPDYGSPPLLLGVIGRAAPQVVLGEEGEAAPARVVRHARGGGYVGGRGRAFAARATTRGSAGGHALCEQLVVRAGARVLLREVRAAFAARQPLVARDRGAVLPHLALALVARPHLGRAPPPGRAGPKKTTCARPRGRAALSGGSRSPGARIGFRRCRWR